MSKYKGFFKVVSFEIHKLGVKDLQQISLW